MLRVWALEKLGGRCPCGFADARALHIDHVANDGSAHRVTTRVRGRRAFLHEVIEDTTGRFQILCANCNTIKEAERLRAEAMRSGGIDSVDAMPGALRRSPRTTCQNALIADSIACA